MKFEGTFAPRHYPAPGRLVVRPRRLCRDDRIPDRIDRAADLPIMLYNYPDRMGIMMGEEFFAWSARSWVCGGSNFLPKEHIALYKACAAPPPFIAGNSPTASRHWLV